MYGTLPASADETFLSGLQFILYHFPRRLEGPIAFPYYVEAYVARAATTATVLRAVPAMPNGDFLLRLALGALLRGLRVNPLRT